MPIYNVFKSFIDPVFIIFILLLISFFVCLKSGKKKGGALLLLLTIILLYGFSIEPVSNFLAYKLEKDYIVVQPSEEKKPLGVVVVLGGGHYDIQTINRTFPAGRTAVRLFHAVQMYKAYNARYLVCSGKGEGTITEAELMAQMAEASGVPKERIRIEPKSENTYEHAVELNKMFPDKSIRIGLVTEAYHMKRSEIEFKKYFSHVLPLPAGYLYASPSGTPAVRYIPQSNRLFDNTKIFREYAGRLWYNIKQ